MTFEKEQSAGYLANHMARLFARGLDARIRPLGLSTGIFPALLELGENDGLTQKELVARLDIEQATMANTLNRMERDGFVTRRKDPTDGRVQRVWLTAKAHDLEGPAINAARAQNDVVLSTLSEEEQAAFLKLMGMAISAMKDSE